MKEIKKGSLKFVQRYNQTLILRLIRQRAPLSRYELSKLTELSPTTVGTAVDELLAMGLLRQTEGSSTGGRKPILLELNAKGNMVLAVGFVSGKFALCNLQGQILKQHSLVFKSQDGPGMLEELAEQLEAFLEVQGRENVLGVGISIPGLVDPETGRVLFSSYLGWQHLPLASRLGEALGLPVMVENDGIALALGETVFREALERGEEDFVYIHAGYGIGATLVLGGEIQRGAGQLAGEIGHMTIDWQGPQCSCGNRGCLETMISIPRLLARYQGITGKALNYAQFMERVEGGDEAALSVLDYCGTLLGVGLVNICNLLNPQLILLGGELSLLGSELLSKLEEYIDLHALPGTREARVQLAVPHQSGELVGAAAMVVERMFTLPNVG
jgi:N-acetylglucosamine repressor